MLRSLSLLLLVVCAPALAQDYSGTYSSTHPTSGSKITLELKQEEKRVSGTLSGSGNTFDVDAEVLSDGIVGEITGENAMVFLVAQLHGMELLVQLFEPGPTGTPDAQSMRQMRMTRE